MYLNNHILDLVRGMLASIGIYLGICTWVCRGIATESCLAQGVIIQPNNIIIKIELYLANTNSMNLCGGGIVML